MAVGAFFHPASLAMAAHVVRARLTRAVRGHHRDDGTAEEILAAGLERCWNGRYLTASPGTYRQFWTRDTGFAAAALVRLDGPWPERLLRTLEWAIESWRRRGSHVTTTISPLGRMPVDLFDYGVDSLPLLLASIRSLIDGPASEIAERAASLATSSRAWLAAEVEHYVRTVVDPATGLVRADRRFSAHRDTFRNGSTAYANTMVALLARTIVETGWGPDLLGRWFERDGGYEWGALLRRHLWVGDRFRDRLGGDETSGEANVWPFFAGLVDDRELQAAALVTLRREGYATPYPLRFAVWHEGDGLLPVFRLYSPDYQTTTSWTSLGSMYLSLLREIDPAAAHVELDRVRALIERDGTLWEVIDRHGRPWRSRIRLSISDASMLWGAILLHTFEQPDAPPLRIGR
jgi:hypothetical protein